MHIKKRIEFLKKIAQLQAVEPEDPTTTDTEVKNEEIGAPSNFDPFSKYPSLRTAFNSSGASEIISRLCSFLNNCVHYSSNGDLDLNLLASSSFSYSGTNLNQDNKDLKFLVLFSKDLYQNIFNNGIAYKSPLSKQEFLLKVNKLIKSQNLNNLSQTNPKSILYKKTGGNIKTQILSILNNLLAVAPSK